MGDPNLGHLVDDKISSKLVMMSNNIPVSKFTILYQKYSKDNIDLLLNRHNVNYPVVYKPIVGTWGNAIKTNIFSTDELYEHIHKNPNIKIFM